MRDDAMWADPRVDVEMGGHRAPAVSPMPLLSPVSLGGDHAGRHGRELVHPILRALRAVEPWDLSTRESSALMLELLRLSVDAGVLQTLLEGGRGARALLYEMHRSTERDYPDATPALEAILRCLPPHTRAQRPAAAGDCILTDRERSVLELIGRGRSNKKIAVELHIAPETVKSHIKHVFVKLGTQTRAQAVVRAATLGLV
jgi:DNA-binding NarL/FixJ family response regulator